MMDEDELLDFLNPFESAIINAPYNSDIIEERKIITEIIMNYSKLGCADHRHRELNIENQKFKFDLFKLFDSWYLWSDVYENNLWKHLG